MDFVKQHPAALIEAALPEVASLMARAYENVSVVDASSPLSQLGLRDGQEIVRDYSSHNELGLVFEHLLYMVIEPPLCVSLECFQLLSPAGKQTGFGPDVLSRVKHEI